MKKYGTIIFVLIFAAAFSVSCKKQSPIKGVELTVEFSDKALTDNFVTNITYKWKTTSEYIKTSTDYVAYVHFWHKTNMLLQDDYYPEIPTSKWEPNREYTFTRRIYIPAFIDEFDPQFRDQETLSLSVGLYSPYDRTGKAKSQILDKTLKVSPPPPDTPEIVYEDGWYEQEVDPKTNLKLWRWTGKEARCLVDNPKRDALLVVKGAVNMDALKDQKVIIRIDDTIVDEFIPTEGKFDKSYTIKKEMLGDKNDFRLIIATDKTFVPARINPDSKDNRELGLQISFIYFR